uniref:Uncharacterized protein n=1 Tax=Cacopsylla melanoneura TaxID=428564 RepID=A0A8D8RNF3_9HEMI
MKPKLFRHRNPLKSGQPGLLKMFPVTSVDNERRMKIPGTGSSQRYIIILEPRSSIIIKSRVISLICHKVYESALWQLMSPVRMFYDNYTEHTVLIIQSNKYLLDTRYHRSI